MLVFVAGLPGSGKSFFASRLAETIHAVYLSSDVIRKELIPNPSYSAQEKEQVYESILKKMHEAAKQGHNIVIDATFYQKTIRARFIKEAKQIAANFVFIEIKAEEALIKKRVSAKREYSDADFEVYKKIKAAFEPIEEKHLVLQSKENNIEDMLQITYTFFKRNND